MVRVWSIALAACACWVASTAAHGSSALEAFDEACTPTLRPYETVTKRLEGLGWSMVPPGADQRLDQAMGNLLSPPGATTRTFEVAMFRRERDGQALHLILQRKGRGATPDLTVCHLYDFAASEPVPDAEFQTRFTDLPTRVLLSDRGRALTTNYVRFDAMFHPDPTLGGAFAREGRLLEGVHLRASGYGQ